MFEKVTNFDYMCDIGGIRTPAVRNSETSLTCQVGLDQVMYSATEFFTLI